MCVAQMGVLFLSLSCSGGCNLSIYNKGLPAVFEGMSRLVCSRGCTKNAISAPELTDFLVHLFRVCLSWCLNGI